MKIRKVAASDKINYFFYCPACQREHKVNDNWDFDGDLEKPTFHPSVLMRTGHYVNNGKLGGCWCDYEERVGKPPPFQCVVCHSFVENGKIRYLEDCTHGMAGQTVELPEIGEDNGEPS